MATVPRTSHPTVHVHHWQGQLLWVIGAGLLGFAMTEFFTSILELPRNWWVAMYAPVVALLAVSYIRWADVDVMKIVRHRWMAGVVVGALFAAVVSVSVIASQSASPRDHGLTFVWQIVWLGVVYGAADAMLLNVLPVYATWQAATELGHTTTWRGKIATGAVALLASLFVTLMYHAGYAEFRSADMRQPLFGNTLISLSYILSANPISAFFVHITMHVTAVVHGVSGTAILPPHY
jgi:hypothetical protein